MSEKERYSVNWISGRAWWPDVSQDFLKREKSQKSGKSVHLWTLNLRHLRMCQQGIEGVVLGDHLFGGQVLGGVLIIEKSVSVKFIWYLIHGRVYCKKSLS